MIYCRASLSLSKLTARSLRRQGGLSRVPDCHSVDLAPPIAMAKPSRGRRSPSGSISGSSSRSRSYSGSDSRSSSRSRSLSRSRSRSRSFSSSSSPSRSAGSRSRSPPPSRKRFFFSSSFHAFLLHFRVSPQVLFQIFCLILEKNI